MSKKLLDSVYQGRNNWQIYLAVLLTIYVYWYYLGGYVINASQSFLSPLLGLNSYANFFISTSIPFVSLFALLFFVVEGLHQRKFHSLINYQASIDIRRLLLGFGVWGVQISAFEVCSLIVNPNNYTYTFDPKQWFLLLPFILILTPIQTSIEELLYRGYLMQGLSLIFKNRLGLILITSILFAITHLSNPEMQRGFIWGAMSYFAWGVFFATITLEDERLELALGVHAANNIFTFLIVNTPDSVMPTPAILTFASIIDAKEEFFYLLFQASIFYMIVFGSTTIKSNLRRLF
jgi:uncharacterized protein